MEIIIDHDYVHTWQALDTPPPQVSKSFEKLF